jgi:hypothetical protein
VLFPAALLWLPAVTLLASLAPRQGAMILLPFSPVLVGGALASAGWMARAIASARARRGIVAPDGSQRFPWGWAVLFFLLQLLLSGFVALGGCICALGKATKGSGFPS